MSPRQSVLGSSSLCKKSSESMISKVSPCTPWHSLWFCFWIKLTAGIWLVSLGDGLNIFHSIQAGWNGLFIISRIWYETLILIYVSYLILLSLPELLSRFVLKCTYNVFGKLWILLKRPNLSTCFPTWIWKVPTRYKKQWIHNRYWTYKEYWWY